MQVDDATLLLLSYDELGLVWDALMIRYSMLDVGDPEYVDVKRLLERVGDLLAARFRAL